MEEMAMFNRLVFLIFTFMPVCLLPMGNLAQGAVFQVYTSSTYEKTPPTTWNPRLSDGLLAVVSEATSASYDASYAQYGTIYTNVFDGSAAAAAYGSDTSSGSGLLDPRLLGYAIEPMVDVQASAHLQCSVTTDLGVFPCYNGTTAAGAMSASATASVNHRVIQRGIVDPALQGIFNGLNSIPVYVDYHLSATASNTGYVPFGSNAAASFSMGAFNVIADTNPNDSCPPNASCFLNEVSGRLQTRLAPSTIDSTVSFVITAQADANAQVGADFQTQRLDGWAQAVADPYLYIDPTWEYAPYFMAQQESLINPGEWVEVTRIWTQPVPEPETYAMMLFGLGLVITVVRRRKQA
jgi:hypothetical protein